MSYSVEKFVEKPDLETAKSYLEDGSYLWNSGMFVWKVSTILDCFKSFMPSTYDGLMKIKASVGTADYQATLEKEFPDLESQSVDYGIMEKADELVILAGMMLALGLQSVELKRTMKMAMLSTAMLLLLIQRTV